MAVGTRKSLLHPNRTKVSVPALQNIPGSPTCFSGGAKTPGHYGSNFLSHDTHRLRELLSSWRVIMSEEFIHLQKVMLDTDLRKGLTIEEVLSHSWFDHPDEQRMQIER